MWKWSICTHIHLSPRIAFPEAQGGSERCENCFQLKCGWNMNFRLGGFVQVYIYVLKYIVGWTGNFKGVQRRLHGLSEAMSMPRFWHAYKKSVGHQQHSVKRERKNSLNMLSELAPSMQWLVMSVAGTPRRMNLTPYWPNFWILYVHERGAASELTKVKGRFVRYPVCAMHFSGSPTTAWVPWTKLWNMYLYVQLWGGNS